MRAPAADDISSDMIQDRVTLLSALLLRQVSFNKAFTPCCQPPVRRRMMNSSAGFAEKMPSQEDTADLKKVLRRDIRSKLTQLSREDLEKESRMVWDRLFQLDAYKNARSIGVFLSMPMGEVLTDTLLLDAAQRGKHIYVPQVGKNFERSEMDLIHIDSATTSDSTLFHTSWPRNKWGIPEPPADSLLQAATPGDLDLLIVPGLAFDEKGNRLGQGKGYYDRFIARMLDPDVMHHPLLVAVGLKCQLLQEGLTIPTNEYDQPMDIILLPQRNIDTRK